MCFKVGGFNDPNLFLHESFCLVKPRAIKVKIHSKILRGTPIYVESQRRGRKKEAGMNE